MPRPKRTKVEGSGIAAVPEATVRVTNLAGVCSPLKFDPPAVAL